MSYEDNVGGKKTQIERCIGGVGTLGDVVGKALIQRARFDTMNIPCKKLIIRKCVYHLPLLSSL